MLKVLELSRKLGLNSGNGFLIYGPRGIEDSLSLSLPKPEIMMAKLKLEITMAKLKSEIMMAKLLPEIMKIKYIFYSSHAKVNSPSSPRGSKYFGWLFLFIYNLFVFYGKQ